MILHFRRRNSWYFFLYSRAHSPNFALSNCVSHQLWFYIGKSMRLYSCFSACNWHRLQNVQIKTRWKYDLIKHLKNINVRVFHILFDVLTYFWYKVINFLSDFFVALWENKSWIFLYFLVKLFYNLAFVKVSSLWLIKHCGFFTFLLKHQSNVIEQLFQ